MREHLEQRLADLRAELSRGQQQLAEVQVRERELRDALLRITGAIQVIEEVLQPHQQSVDSSDQSDT